MEACRSVCGVCGDQTSNHAHYGALVCNSCRIFFRRTVGTVNKKEKWKCKSGKNSCPITKELRSYCKLCRYNRCLELGMKPELVDKTKKAIEAYFAQEKEKSQEPMEVSCSETNEVKENLSTKASGTNSAVQANTAQQSDHSYHIPVCESDSKLVSVLVLNDEEDNSIEYADSYTVSTLVGSDRAPCIQNVCEKPAVDGLSMISMCKLNCDDVSYFAHLVKTYKEFDSVTWRVFSDNDLCIKEMEEYGRQVMNIMYKKSRRMSYKTLFDGAFQRIYRSEHLNHLREKLREDSAPLEAINEEFIKCYDVLGIFDGYSEEGKTLRSVLAIWGHNVQEPPYSKLFPRYMWDAKLPNLLSTTLFDSPWAETLELEEFFFRVARIYKDLMDNQVMKYICVHLLLASIIRELHGSQSFIQEGHLTTILYKHIHAKSVDPEAANHRFTQTLMLMEDIRTCAKIFKEASIMDKTEPEFIDIDAIKVDSIVTSGDSIIDLEQRD